VTESWPPPRGLERIVFFSDGVFAIAITLLVIDLRLPDLPDSVSSATLSSALVALLPRVFAYLLSFGVIGLYWLAHWRRFHWIERSNGRLAMLNLLLLGCIAFIPFPTALIGAHGDRPIAVVIYAVSVSLPGVVGPATWLYATRAGLARADITPQIVRLGAVRGLAVSGVMLASLLLLPFVAPWVVEDSWVLILVIQFVLVRRFAPQGQSA
jgi:uncharacterized membrane protein